MRSKEYIIEFNKVRMGLNEYDFVINDAFLQEIEGAMAVGADVKVTLELFRSETMYDLKFVLTGKAVLECDVCLENFEMPVEGSYHLLIKLSETEDYTDDEIVYITKNVIEYDLRQYLYECFVLSLPGRKTCEMSGSKQCNPEIVEKLKGLSIENARDDKDDDDTDDRWDKLKEILN